MEMVETEYEWTVGNYTFRRKKFGESIESPIFSFNIIRRESPIFFFSISGEECKWHIDFYPRGVEKSNKNYVAIFLTSLNDFDIRVNFTLSVSAYDCQTNEIVGTGDFEHTFKYNGNGYGCTKIVKYDLVKNKNIKIVWKINTQADKPSLKATNDKMKLKFLESQCRLKEFDKLGELLYSGDFSDVIIKVNEKEFKVHKYILASKSSVFHAMFSNDAKENLGNIIEIIDIDSGVMEEVLYFMYTGKVKQISNLTMKMFVAADKYIIDGLKTICIQEISKNITMQNVLETLDFARSYDIEKLHDDCINFIAEHRSDLLKN